MKLALAVAFLSLAPSVLHAGTTIHVPDDVATIQGAIALAQDGDTVLVAPGTYPEALDFLGKAITVTSAGGAALTTIDAATAFDSAVTFHTGEGPGSVLRGFTVQGGDSSQRAGGISCFGTAPTSPLVQHCIIRDNRTNLGLAGGIDGNPTLEDCLIEANFSPYQAGGIAGAPIVRRCTIRGNNGYDGGGAYLFGGRISDSIIADNTAYEGTHGGGVYLSGNALLERCLITGNSAVAAGQYMVAAGGVYAYAAPSGPRPRMASCTVVGNHVVQPFLPFLDNCGGVNGPVRLVNTIVRDNDQLDVIENSGVSAFYCDIDGGLAGPGNFDLDPLFRDAPNGDYRLQLGSPCIDTGTPTGPPDPDGTRTDVGALAFPHATVYAYNGNGGNPSVLSSLNPPQVGSSWSLRIDASGFSRPLVSGLMARGNGLTGGVLLTSGELLLDLGSPLVFLRSQASSGSNDDFANALPPDPALVGLRFYVQGFVVAGGAQLSNALEVHLGE